MAGDLAVVGRLHGGRLGVVQVVLDANSLTSDFSLSGPTFVVLAREIDTENLQVYVSEVAVMETVGNHTREVADARENLAGLARKRHRVLPPGATAELDGVLVAKAAEYEDVLRARLEQLGAVVLPIPDVPHEQFVRRALERLAPCDSNGNGYRDSLIWETVLEAVRDGTLEDGFALVTADGDFALDTDGELVLKPGLAAELAELVVTDPVVCRDLHDAVRELLPVGTNETRGQIAQSVRLELLNEWLADCELSEQAMYQKVEPEAVALPLSSSSAEIVYVEDVKLVGDVHGLRALGENFLIEFEVTADACIDFWVDQWRLDDDDSRTQVIAYGSLGESNARIVKSLLFDCLATVDPFGRPLALEISRVHAHEDDPDLGAWDPDVCGCTSPRYRGPR